MSFTELLNIKYISNVSNVDYGRLRSNLLARPEKVRLTREEKDAIIKAVEEGVQELKTFLG